MIKAIYKTSNLFSLKKYAHSNINCQSYEYPLAATIRGSILGQIIRLEGVERARELFEELKSSDIHIQYSDYHKVSGKGIKRVANSGTSTTFGHREYVDIDQIAFYISTELEDIEVYLKNIDYIGTADSLVYLDSVEKVDKAENILVEWNQEEDVDIYENADWTDKIGFDDVYIYNEKHKLSKCNRRFMCKVGDIDAIL